MHTAEAPFARALASQELFACCWARKRSLPNPLPNTICMLHAFAKPQTRTDADAVHDQLPPAAAGAAAGAGVAAGAVAVAAAGPVSTAGSESGSVSAAVAGAGAATGAVAGGAAFAGARAARGPFGVAGSDCESASAADASTSPPMARHDPPPTTSKPPMAIKATTSGEIPAFAGGKGR